MRQMFWGMTGIGLEQDKAVVAEALGLPDVSIAYLMGRLDQLGLTLHGLRGRRTNGPASVELYRYDGRVFRAEADSFEEVAFRAAADAVRQVPRGDSMGVAVGRGTIQVVGATGECPLGYEPGRTWALSDRGNIYPGLCELAIAGLRDELQKSAKQESYGAFCRRCPRGAGQAVEVRLQMAEKQPSRAEIDQTAEGEL